MYQFFVESSQILNDNIVITGSDVNHIGNVLRMKLGEKIRVSTIDGMAYFCLIESIGKEEVVCKIESRDESGTELSNEIYLFQGIPKSDKMELIIQKAVELGVYKIIPVSMKNCVAKVEEKKASKKVERWQNIAVSAAKQSKRTIIPDISMPVTWKQAMKMVEDLDITLVPYENQRGMEATREVIEGIKEGQSIGIIIGPEGGFAISEIEDVDKVDSMNKISLGRRILRTETAGLATLSMLVYRLDK